MCKEGIRVGDCSNCIFCAPNENSSKVQLCPSCKQEMDECFICPHCGAEDMDGIY